MTDAEFLTAARRNPNNDAILSRLPLLGCGDCWLVSGALFQTLWNLQCGLAPDHGIKDYDIFYFDPDTSWDAEDATIKKARVIFSDLPIVVEPRNQARVHLWYEEKMGMPYPALSCATEGIDRFLSQNSMVGVRADGRVYAPHGYGDMEAMVVRPNRAPNFSPVRYLEKARRWQSLWPRITVLTA